MKKIVFIIVALALLGGVLMYVKHQRDVPRAASKEEARQTAAAAPPSQQSPPSDRGKRADEGVKMNIDLAKGSKLKDLAALVDKDYPDYALNIPDELQDAEISELKLHDAAMSDLAKALDMMGDGRFSTTYSYNHTLFIQPIQPIQPVGAPPHIVDPNRPDINIDLPDSSTLGDLIEVLKTKYPQYGFHLQSEKFKELKIGAFKVKGDSLQKLISDLITVGSPRFIATSPDGWNVFFLGGGYGIIKVFNL
ncbi:MAG TPA: hypothetical protein VG733_17870, partial [Chthoniobacteraceae bacterium]|nr:hypothetical protein [Chthoniobacteraceae bacterium]